ncbi:MAG: hypothetical protein J2P54_23775, partial [Bradyrhizobiaceae bacterium]|nr:hypothetical protein [Bradyrhizobiaceae bacterium]
MSVSSLPTGTTILIRGGRVLLPDGDWDQPKQVDLAIAGDRIAGLASAYDVTANDAVETIDGNDSLVLPGFINAHYHSH